MTCGNDDFREFLEQASRTVAAWPKWKREVLGSYEPYLFAGPKDPAEFARQIEGTWDLGGGTMARTLQEELKIQLVATDHLLVNPEGYSAPDLMTWRNQRCIVAALIHLLDLADRQVHLKPATAWPTGRGS
jgi:hypothetical protein